LKILVTGASGTLGGHVIRELESAHTLRLFSRRHPRDGAHKLETSHPHIAGDLLDPAAVRRAAEGMDAVAHLGANPWFSPETFTINTTGTYNVLEACRAYGIKRFVMAGSDWGVGKSDQVVRPPDYVPVDEAHPARPRDHYGLSKILNERTVEAYAAEYGMRTAVLRITGVWSPEATAAYAGKDHANAARECAMYWWTYVDARDVARAFRLALEAPDLPAFGAYFISAADSMIDEPTADAVRTFWPGVEIRGGLAPHGSVLSGKSAERVFGFVPMYTWRKEIREGNKGQK